MVEVQEKAFQIQYLAYSEKVIPKAEAHDRRVGRRGENMEKYVDCHNCQNQYDCERTYLGGCTDGKEWEQEEKKMIDEEIVKALEHCATENTCKGCVKYNKETTIDYFKCMRDTRKNVVDLFHRLQANNAEQKAEIERLTEEKDKYQTKWHRAYMNELNLQKQVDELKEEKLSAVCDLNMRIVELDNELKQAVKDTAKEILKKVKSLMKKNSWFNLKSIPIIVLDF